MSVERPHIYTYKEFVSDHPHQPLDRVLQPSPAEYMRLVETTARLFRYLDGTRHMVVHYLSTGVGCSGEEVVVNPCFPAINDGHARRRYIRTEESDAVAFRLGLLAYNKNPNEPDTIMPEAE